jgi:signal transduction histidine kinase
VTRRLLLISLLLFARVIGAQSLQGKTVLVLFDGGREFKSIQLTDQGIEAGLAEYPDLGTTVFREYLDLTRVRSPDYTKTLQKFYRAKYAANRPDVIIAIRGRSLDFLIQHGDDLFPRVPLVSSAMDMRQIQARKLPAQVTGNTLKVRYEPSVRLALKLMPDTKEIYVILGASPNDRALEALVRDEFGRIESPVRFTYLAGLSIESLLKRVAELPPRSAVLFASFAQDGDGKSFLPHDVLPRIAGAATAPMYIASDDVLDIGAVGGDVISFEAVGKESGRIAARILRGEAPQNIPFAETSARATAVDARQLKRWSIPLSRVPEGSIVTNHVPTLWGAYKWWIAGGISLIILQTTLIARMVVHRRRQRLAEARLKSSEAQAQTAVLEERDRMARDMHDTLAQGFTGVIVQLEAAQQAVAQGSRTAMDDHIQRASALARQSLGEARRSIRALRPQALENTDLCAALLEATKLMTIGTSLQGELTIEGQPRALSALKEENLLRVFQELLTNALKHSHASIFRSSISFDGEAVVLEAQDNGDGFELGTKNDGLGLLGIRERVNQMNGKLIIESRPGAGTRISVRLPN